MTSNILAALTSIAIIYILQDKQLPMLVSTFWSTIQKCGIAGEGAIAGGSAGAGDGAGAGAVTLDVKRSSHKKVSVFLDAMASTNGDYPPLLCLQCTNGVASVTAVQRAHDWLRGVKGMCDDIHLTGTLALTTI